ncbi:MAG TPA: hypothetical protein VJN18_09055 [Polyangiaceae bacterium]|nr:hypothetical protein [Polyangiaceae bacterium]
MKVRILASLASLAALTLTPLAAYAAGVAETSPTGKGIAGGALLGAELVLVTEAAFDVQPAWAYIVGGLAGGAAGGVGGYFVEQEGDARVPMLMLAGGLAFAIPTVVAVAVATHYEPPADYLQDQPPADEPLAEPPPPSEGASPPAASPPPGGASPEPAPAAPEAAPAPTGRRQLRSKRPLSLKLPPPALLGFRESRLALGVPNIELRHAFTPAERMMFNAPDVAEWRIPVLDVVF